MVSLSHHYNTAARFWKEGAARSFGCLTSGDMLKWNISPETTTIMIDRTAILEELIALSRWLGDPAHDLAILGEGNSSALLDDQTFLVKASGRELRTADENSF